MKETRGAFIDTLSPELREARLRTVVDELRWHRDKLTREVRMLRERVERQDIRLRAIRRERSELEEQLRHAQHELARRPS